MKSTKFIQRGNKEGPSRVTNTVKITKFTKTAKFTIIVRTSDEIYEIYARGSKEGPLKVTKTAKIFEIYENCEICDNCQDH